MPRQQLYVIIFVLNLFHLLFRLFEVDTFILLSYSSFRKSSSRPLAKR